MDFVIRKKPLGYAGLVRVVRRMDAYRVGITRPQPRPDKGGLVCESERLDFLVAVCRAVQGPDADVEPGTWRTGA